MKNSCFKFIVALPFMPIAMILYPFANYNDIKNLCK